MKTNKYGAKFTGKPSDGCKLCWPGCKLVVFVGGKCNKTCFYCPISQERKGNDFAYANERPIKSDNDLVREAKEMNAKGASITGGEPLLYLNDVLHYIKLLKKEFGEEFHIHLYTWGDLATKDVIKKLEEAGLDEIRFHLFGNFERILPALKSKIRVGVEIPVLPNQKDYLKMVLEFCAKNKAAFVNLNELEFSDSNWEKMEKGGFKTKSKIRYGVKGSEELALELIKYAEHKYPKLNVHYCSVYIKNAVQLVNRLKRRARIVKKPFESVNKYGMIICGAVEGSLDKLRIIEENEKNACFNSKKKRIETSVAKSKILAKRYGLKAFEIIKYPIYEPWDFEKIPLN